MSAALRQQYGLRANSQEFAEMPWEEFADLMRGLSGDTALARVARIRTETDPEQVRRMTASERRMRTEWQRRRAMERSDDERARFLALIQAAFANAFGKEG